MLAVLASTLALPASPSHGASPDPWMASLRADALAQGISAATFDAALAGIELRPAVIEADRSQPRAPKDFCGYLDRRLTATRIARGQRMLVEHRKLLNGISAEYGVPPRYLVALWGLETNFGDYQGDHPLFEALVTLARDARRGDLFRGQIFAALRMIEEGHAPDRELRASWAGAMGQVQFMPTTYLEYAVDHDGDGRRDLWGSVPDALASAANYLRRSGWTAGETWGRQVTLPETLEPEVTSLSGARSLSEWQALGLRRSDGGELPEARLRGRLVLPERQADPAFLVYRNYGAFMRWNRSTFFSISVGTLADEIAGRSSLRACRG